MSLLQANPMRHFSNELSSKIFPNSKQHALNIANSSNMQDTRRACC